MPSIKDESTIKALAQAFCSNGRNQEQAMISVGYSTTYARSYCGQLWANSDIRDAIAEIDAKTAKISDWNKEANLKACKEQLDSLAPACLKGNIQAIQARTAVIRELNASNGLHSSTLITEPEQPIPMTEEEYKSVRSQAVHLTGLRIA